MKIWLSICRWSRRSFLIVLALIVIWCWNNILRLLVHIRNDYILCIQEWLLCSSLVRRILLGGLQKVIRFHGPVEICTPVELLALVRSRIVVFMLFPWLNLRLGVNRWFGSAVVWVSALIDVCPRLLRWQHLGVLIASHRWLGQVHELALRRLMLHHWLWFCSYRFWAVSLLLVVAEPALQCIWPFVDEVLDVSVSVW